MEPSNSRVKIPEVTVFGILLEAVNWFCCHCLFYAHLKSFFSIQSKWWLCKYNTNFHNYHLWSEHFLGHSFLHRWRFCCVRWSFVHFFSLNVRIFFFFFFAEHTQLMQNCTWHPSREIFLLRRQASSHLCGMSRRRGGRQKANSWGFS